MTLKLNDTTHLELAVIALSTRGTNGIRVVLVEKVNKKMVQAVKTVEILKELRNELSENWTNIDFIMDTISHNAFYEGLNRNEEDKLKTLIL